MSSSDIPNASRDLPSSEYSRIYSWSITDNEMTMVRAESDEILSQANYGGWNEQWDWKRFI